MSTVNFTAMVNGTREDYDLVFAHDVENGSHMAERVVGWMRSDVCLITGINVSPQATLYNRNS